MKMAKWVELFRSTLKQETWLSASRYTQEDTPTLHRFFPLKKGVTREE